MSELTWISGSLCTSTYFAGFLATEEGSKLVPTGVCACTYVCVHVCVCGCHGIHYIEQIEIINKEPPFIHVPDYTN